ncbi:MAG TPA: putative Ig domain-containing protein [Chthoniobacterales bacterium]|nr:putative Ig domain-containing protein [Chthoniobacterales bacterium]
MHIRVTRALLCVLGSLIVSSHAWVQNNGYNWPAGTNITMRLQLSRTAVNFIDGSSSWNAVAASALTIWNQHLDSVQFVQAAGSSSGANDRQNSVFFSSSVYGESFGGAIAVTIGWNDAAHPQTIVETDVIFNSASQWNSYRGPLRADSRGRYIHDLRRVALHEFGHVLGLGHPDERGQSAYALMNSITSDLDALTDDDIAGARHIYGFRFLSSTTPPQVTVGEVFNYQIVANNSPSSHSANGLPPGLQLDAATGVISGVPTAAGTYTVAIIAHGAVRDVTATIRISVVPPVITSLLYQWVEIGTAFRYQITASNQPTSFSAEGLPPGLTLDPSTGVISGLPTAAGTFSVMLTARGGSAEATARLQIMVASPTITSSIYPPAAQIGSSFAYQITASRAASRFSTSELPAGLQLDSATGLISGIPTLSGTYSITVTAHGPFGDASATLQITILALRHSDELVTTFDGVNGLIVADPRRPRVYAVANNSLAVIDTESLAVIKTIPLSTFVADMSISADGTKLWIASYNTIGSFDLNTLEPLPPLRTTEFVRRIREGLDQRLYVTTENAGGVAQVDAVTGAVQGRFSPGLGHFSPSFLIEISPDRRTLYVARSGYPDSIIARYDISSPTASLIQTATQTGSTHSLALSPDGQQLCVVPSGSPSAPIPVRAANDLTLVHGAFDAQNAPGFVAFSSDGAWAFGTSSYSSSVAVFDTQSRQLVRRISQAGQGQLNRIAVDVANRYLFVTTSDFKLQVYRINPSPAGSAPPRSLVNVSTRLRSQSGENALIGGFILTGSTAKTIAVRAIGPSLPLAEKLADPVLELRDAAGELIAANDNWNSHRSAVLASRLGPIDEREAVVIAAVPPGSYTATVSGVKGASGVALVEVYDLDGNPASRLANISTRGRVETGDNVMIGGFIIGGDQPTRVIVRAIGPSLSSHDVPGALSDTTLDLHDGNGALLASNDDWRADESEIAATTIPPADDRESAIVRTLAPGNYTAIVRGKTSTTGVALVEVYNLETN